MQSASDIFLGWTHDSDGRHFYVRQLRDMKLKFRIEQFKPAKMVIFADWCGGTLVRPHARSGEPAMISGYLGKADTFDQAIAAFAVAYADQVDTAITKVSRRRSSRGNWKPERIEGCLTRAAEGWRTAVRTDGRFERVALRRSVVVLDGRCSLR